MYLHAILFDFDGVLADTERLHLRAYQEVLGEQGVRLSADEYYRHYLGLDDYHVLLAIARNCALPPGDARVRSLLERKARRYADLIATSPLLFDGVETLVRAWSRHVPLAIASGALRHEIETVLERAQLLDGFAAIVSANDVAHGKPAPDPFLVALERVRAAMASDARKGTACRAPTGTRDLSPHGCVVIEDSLPGIAAAKAAGMRVVAVATNHPPGRLTEADLVVPSVTSLRLSTLDRLVAGNRPDAG